MVPMEELEGRSSGLKIFQLLITKKAKIKKEKKHWKLFGKYRPVRMAAVQHRGGPVCDRPAGRGRKLTPSAVKQVAIDAGIDVGLTQDFEGNPIPLGSAPDIGAYEKDARVWRAGSSLKYDFVHD